MIQSRKVDSEKIAEIVLKIVALRRLTEMTGFKTSRSQGEILKTLTPDELAAVSMALENCEPDEGDAEPCMCECHGDGPIEAFCCPDRAAQTMECFGG